MPASFKKRLTLPATTNQGVVWFDDFLEVSTQASTPLFYGGTYVSGGGTGSAQVVPGYGSTYPGAITLYVESLNDSAVLSTTPNYNLANSSLLDIQSRATNINLSTVSQIYVNSFGYSDNFFDRSSETNSAVIYYDKSVSDNYICSVKKQSVGTTQVVTSIAASTNDTYFRVMIVPNRCYFWINNVLVANISQSPDVVNGSIGWSRLKSVGTTTGSSLSVDAIGVTQQFTTPRSFINPTANPITV